MQSDGVQGTFLTVETVPGSGVADAGVYTLRDFSVYQSSFSGLDVGSVSNGTYVFGSQPSYQFQWSGTGVTQFLRDSGNLSNGFSVYNGAGGTGAQISFDKDYQYAIKLPTSPSYFFVQFATPRLSPIGASGKCPGEV